MSSLKKKTVRSAGIFLVALLLVLLGGTSVQKFSPETQSSLLRLDSKVLYRIVRVVDGDTLDVIIDGQKVRIRLIGLDTPETVDPRRPLECFGIEASNEAKKVLSGEAVRIEIDPSQGLYDKYDRLLAYVFLSDGTLFNEMMIEEGYGHEYTYNEPYHYQREFQAAEERARAEKLGLWADGVCENK